MAIYNRSALGGLKKLVEGASIAGYRLSYMI
jgi:hypothetical protein